MAKTVKKGKAKESEKPQIIAAKGGDTQAQFLKRILATMDEGNWITSTQAKDFVESLKAVVLDDLEHGKPVNMFGLVKIVPRLHTAGEREVFKVFGDPESGKTIKKVKSKVSLKTGQGIFTKAVKDALPNPQKLAKLMGR